MKSIKKKILIKQINHDTRILKKTSIKCIYYKVVLLKEKTIK